MLIFTNLLIMLLLTFSLPLVYKLVYKVQNEEPSWVFYEKMEKRLFGIMMLIVLVLFARIT